MSGAGGAPPNQKIYFRKARQIRHISFRPELSGRYSGSWNATTNTPTLADNTGVDGEYYYVSVAGSQDLGSGVIAFSIGDWVKHNGTVWQKATQDPREGSCDDVIGKLTVTFTGD